MSNYDCVIVGSGINALVCAAMLAKQGRKICVLERNDRLGGCIRTEEVTVPGFTHDVLSSWHPLFVSSPGYAELKADLEKYGLEYCHSDSPTAVVLDDGRNFIFKRDRNENIQHFDELNAGDGERYARSMAELDASLDLTFTLLGSELWTWATAKMFLQKAVKVGPHNLARFFGLSLENARRWLELTFESDLGQAVLAGWPTHAGIGPEAAASGQMARVMAFSLEAAGCPVVKGGSFKLVDAFRQLIEAHGGELHVNADVDHVVTANGKARGVRTVDGKEYQAYTAVICSMTPTQLYTRLLGPADVPNQIASEAKAFKYGNADMQIHLALDQPPQWRDPEMAKVAVTHITPGLDGVSRAINEAACGLLPAVATIVVGQPAALDPTRVPEGKSLLWLQLQELPSRIKGDAANKIEIPGDGKWNETVREQYADRIVDRVAGHIVNLKDNILGRAVFSPADLEALNINLVGGDPYAGACTLDQFFLWRPLRATKNHTTPVKNLYHIGASTHPGPGLGGVSGYLVAKLLA